MHTQSPLSKCNLKFIGQSLFRNWYLFSRKQIHSVSVEVIVLYLGILLQLVLEFIFSHLPSTMQQYQDLKPSPFFLIRHFTTHGIEGGTKLSSFTNNVNTRTPNAIARSTQ
jgi:hypothetical protein